MPTTNIRHHWIDATKGVAILLVVVGHVWRGLESAGLLSGLPSRAFIAIDQRIYAFHMPLFFMLSGLFLVQGIVGRSAPEFLRSRVVRLLYPMMLWTYLFLGAKAAIGTLANEPVDWADVLRLPIPGYSQFWFIWALFVLQIAMLPLRPILANNGTKRITLTLLLVAGLIFTALPWPGEILYWTNRAPIFLCYLVLGTVLYNFGLLKSATQRLALVSFCLFGLLLAALPPIDLGGLLWAITAIALCLTLLAGLSWLFREPSTLTRGFAVLGQASMIIFLSHTFFTAFLRIAMVQLGIETLWLHLILGILVGVLCPLILLWLSRRFGVTRWIGA